jgi:type I restriction enzyme, S subunit
MRDGWKALPLSEVIEHTIGGVWGGESATDEVEVTVVRSTEFTKRGYLNFETGVSRSIKHSQLKSRELKEGDILLEKSGGGPDQPVGRVVYVTAEIPNKFVCSNFVQLVRPNSMVIEPLLLFHIMWQWHAINRTLEFQAQTTGIRNLRTPDYLDQEINLPPLPEQKRIVDLISSVDSYIEALQQQLESAKRSRGAVLHELLTAGGDGWIETTLDVIAEVIMGQSPDGKTYNQEGKGLPFMQGSAEFGEHYPVPEKWCSDPKKIAEPGDLLLSVRAPVGDTNFADQRIAVGRGLSIIRANKESKTEFIRLVIQLNVAELIASSGSGMFASITGKNLKEFKINLPPLPEQKRIVTVISELDSFIHCTETSMNRTKALRSGLLSQLLSGEHEIPSSYDKVMGAA